MSWNDHFDLVQQHKARAEKYRGVDDAAAKKHEALADIHHKMRVAKQIREGYASATGGNAIMRQRKESTDLLNQAREAHKQLTKSDKIPGGLADNKSPKDFDRKKILQGAKVEKEHTSSPAVAKEIAMDHLTEDPGYYMKLKKIEKIKVAGK